MTNQPERMCSDCGCYPAPRGRSTCGTCYEHARHRGKTKAQRVEQWMDEQDYRWAIRRFEHDTR